MIRAIDDYLAGTINLPELVGSLQGALDAGEFKDDRLVNDWYERWGDLEIWNASHGAAAPRAEVAKLVQAMRDFLLASLPG